MNARPAANPHKICYVFGSYSRDKGTVTMIKVPSMEMMDASGNSFFLPKAEGSAKHVQILPEGVQWQDALSVAGRSRVTANKEEISLSAAFNMKPWEDMNPVERCEALYKPVLTRLEKARMQEAVGPNVVPMQLAANG